MALILSAFKPSLDYCWDCRTSPARVYPDTDGVPRCLTCAGACLCCDELSCDCEVSSDELYCLADRRQVPPIQFSSTH